MSPEQRTWPEHRRYSEDAKNTVAEEMATMEPDPRRTIEGIQPEQLQSPEVVDLHHPTEHVVARSGSAWTGLTAEVTRTSQGPAAAVSPVIAEVTAALSETSAEAHAPQSLGRKTSQHPRAVRGLGDQGHHGPRSPAPRRRRGRFR